MLKKIKMMIEYMESDNMLKKMMKVNNRNGFLKWGSE